MTMLACIFFASCEAFTPPFDPREYPCGDPRMHYCASGRTCCWENEACEENPPRCEYVGPVMAPRDAGRER